MGSWPDFWAPPATLNPTHSFRMAGVTPAASVVIENDTALQLLVSNNPDTPPPADVNANPWRLVPPGANVTWPLGTAGVAYTLIGTPAAGAAVQTILSDEAAPSGGTTGTVNIASGQVTISGPVDVNVGNTPTVNVGGPVAISSGTVDVQTSAGVSIGTKAVVTAIGNMLVPASGPSAATNFTLPADAQSVWIEWPASSPGVQSLIINIVGTSTGTRYLTGLLDPDSSTQVPVNAVDDPVIQVTATRVTAGVGNVTLTLSASTAQAPLGFSNLFPFSPAAAASNFNKNVWIHEAHAKASAFGALATAGPLTLIAAPGANIAIQLHRINFGVDAAVPACVATISGGGFRQDVEGSAAGTFSIDCAGIMLTVNTALTVSQIGGPAVYRITVLYSLVGI